MDSLVSTDWLAAHLGEAGLVVLNASKHLPDEGRDAAAEHSAGHIPGARFLDLDALGRPGEAETADRLAALGIGEGVRVVLYDDSPLHSAARGWWILRQYGLGEVALLDGGLAKWRAEGRALESGEGGPVAAVPAPVLDGRGIRHKADVHANLDSHAAQLVDARSAGRFAGVAPEPHPGVAPGHIPGSRNLPQGDLFMPDGTWKRDVTLRAAFEEAGVEPERPVIATCGSGVTAAVLTFGLHLLGRTDMGLYEGSWTDWGSDPATPKEQGA